MFEEPQVTCSSRGHVLIDKVAAEQYHGLHQDLSVRVKPGHCGTSRVSGGRISELRPQRLLESVVQAQQKTPGHSPPVLRVWEALMDFSPPANVSRATRKH